jgi:hypothetical protein
MAEKLATRQFESLNTSLSALACLLPIRTYPMA